MKNHTMGKKTTRTKNIHPTPDNGPTSFVRFSSKSAREALAPKLASILRTVHSSRGYHSWGAATTPRTYSNSHAIREGQGLREPRGARRRGGRGGTRKATRTRIGGQAGRTGTCDFSTGPALPCPGAPVLDPNQSRGPEHLHSSLGEGLRAHRLLPRDVPCVSGMGEGRAGKHPTSIHPGRFVTAMDTSRPSSHRPPGARGTHLMVKRPGRIIDRPSEVYQP